MQRRSVGVMVARLAVNWVKVVVSSGLNTTCVLGCLAWLNQNSNAADKIMAAMINFFIMSPFTFFISLTILKRKKVSVWGKNHKVLILRGIFGL